MSYRLQVLKAFIKKEVTQTLRDPRMKMLLFVAPILQLCLFGIALSSETRNVKLAIVAEPSDVLMADLAKRSFSSGWFVDARTTGHDPYGWISAKEADAVLIAPPGGLGRAVARGQGQIQLLLDGQNSARSQSIEGYLKAISGAVYAPQGVEKAKGLSFDVRALYNPTFESSLFMVPGVLSMLVCLVTILLTSMAVAREKEIGTIETLTSAPIDALDMMIGKTTPFVLIGAVQMPLALAFAVWFFKLPIRGPLWMLVIASLLMITATVAIGLLVSSISRTQQQAMFGGFMFLMPSYLLSGLLFPIDNMPAYVQPLAYINPLTHYMGLLRNILLIGGDFSYFLLHSGVLLAIAVVCMSFATYRFKSTMI